MEKTHSSTTSLKPKTKERSEHEVSCIRITEAAAIHYSQIGIDDLGIKKPANTSQMASPAGDRLEAMA